MTDNEILAQYKKLVPFLAQLCGPSSEVLLHDVTAPEKSVIEIANGFHSGRSVGSPLTDLALSLIKQRTYENMDFMPNYRAEGGGKNFVASTFFVKNEGRLIGLLCVNRDMSALVALETALQNAKSQYSIEPPSGEAHESLDASSGKLLQNMVEQAVNDMGVLPSRMSRSEKITVVKRLDERGVLDMKGAIPEVARQLCTSGPTIYRYINKAKSMR